MHSENAIGQPEVELQPIVRQLLRCVRSQPQFILQRQHIPEEINEVTTTHTQSEVAEGEEIAQPICRCCSYYIQLANILREENTNLKRQNGFLLNSVRSKTHNSVAIHEKDMLIIRLKETVKGLTRQNSYVVADLKNQLRQLELKLGQSMQDEETAVLRQKYSRANTEQQNIPRLTHDASKTSLGQHTLQGLTSKLEGLLKLAWEDSSSIHKKQQIRRQIISVASEIKLREGLTDNA